MFQHLLLLSLLSSLSYIQSDQELNRNDNEQPLQASTLEWSYDSISEWGSISATCSNGKRQSPITLDLKIASRKSFSPFKFRKYDTTLPMYITNEAGHSLRIYLKPDLPVDKLPSIRGGGLPGDDDASYVFAQIHFHWGNETMGHGSEHVIGSNRFPAEMHLVHFNKKYGSVSEAVKHDDGLAVLGVLLKRAPSNGRAVYPFGNFLNFIETIKEKEATVRLSNPFPLMDLLPASTDSFYRYSGSLTTPGCHESVTWTVFDTPLAISTNQLLKFQNLLNENGGKLTNNYRPTQPLNGRRVYYRSSRNRRD